MAERFEVFKCEICGNIIEVLHGGKGQLVCCNESMKLMEEKSAEMATEKHVPVVEKTSSEGELKVYVGSTVHPMDEKHYIEWIQVIDADGTFSYRKFLKPGDDPEAVFHLCKDCIDGVKAREYCNIHLLWKS